MGVTAQAGLQATVLHLGPDLAGDRRQQGELARTAEREGARQRRAPSAGRVVDLEHAAAGARTSGDRTGRRPPCPPRVPRWARRGSRRRSRTAIQRRTGLGRRAAAASARHPGRGRRPRAGRPGRRRHRVRERLAGVLEEGTEVRTTRRAPNARAQRPRRSRGPPRGRRRGGARRRGRRSSGPRRQGRRSRERRTGARAHERGAGDGEGHQRGRPRRGRRWPRSRRGGGPRARTDRVHRRLPLPRPSAPADRS